jgi:hypothetical protein
LGKNGNKVTFIMTSIGCIIIGTINIEDNRHDSTTIPELLELLSSLYDGFKPCTASVPPFAGGR